jgi:predicted HAD superfamily Cof-like phosphohydrolase
MVTEFHVATGSTVGETPGFRDVNLRINLILEEVSEFESAASMISLGKYGPTLNADPSFTDAVKELCDILYVTLGTAVAWGIDILPWFEEVHRSNMTKIIGVEKRADGKVKKGPYYVPPDFSGLL